MVCRQSTICRQICRPTYASQLPVSPVFASKPKFWYLHGSQLWMVLVLHLSGAGWSGLPWGVPPTVPGADHPRWTCISRCHYPHMALESKRWYFPTLATGSSVLPYSMVRIDGKQIVPMQGLAVPFLFLWHTT